MKSGLRLMLAVAAIVFLASASAEARGGRGGGGGGRAPAAHAPAPHAQPHPAQREAQPAQREARPAERNSEHPSANRNENHGNPNQGNQNRNANRDQNHNNGERHENNPYAHHYQPFSPEWYAHHPGAWQYTHPYADVWAAASLGTAAAWLGLAGYAAPVYDNTYYTSDTTANNSGNANSDSQAWNAATTDNASDDDTLDGTAWTGGEPPAPPAPAAAGAPFSNNYLTLGIFALVPSGQSEPSALVQLSVGKDGSLRGSYTDVVTDEAATVYGSVDKQTQAAQFQVGDNGKVVFSTSLADLTQGEGTVTVRFGNGPPRQWTLVRQVHHDDATVKTGSQE